MTPAQRTEFRVATRELRDWYATRFGAEWLQRTDAAIAACERKFPSMNPEESRS
jgi:hypothetical protein